MNLNEGLSELVDTGALSIGEGGLELSSSDPAQAMPAQLVQAIEEISAGIDTIQADVSATFASELTQENNTVTSITANFGSAAEGNFVEPTIDTPDNVIDFDSKFGLT